MKEVLPKLIAVNRNGIIYSNLIKMSLKEYQQVLVLVGLSKDLDILFSISLLNYLPVLIDNPIFSLLLQIYR